MTGEPNTPESSSAAPSAVEAAAAEVARGRAVVRGPSPEGVTAAETPLLGGPASAIALAFIMFVEAVGYGVVAPTLPFLARAAGAGEARIGFLVGLYASVGLLVTAAQWVTALGYLSEWLRASVPSRTDRSARDRSGPRR